MEQWATEALKRKPNTKTLQKSVSLLLFSGKEDWGIKRKVLPKSSGQRNRIEVWTPEDYTPALTSI